VIAASKPENTTPMEGELSFSKNLISELENTVTKTPQKGAFAYYIYNQLLSRMNRIVTEDGRVAPAPLRFNLNPHPSFERSTVWVGRPSAQSGGAVLETVELPQIPVRQVNNRMRELLAVQSGSTLHLDR
jgi:hypothetical protein